jgi:hypothetical protein
MRHAASGSGGPSSALAGIGASTNFTVTRGSACTGTSAARRCRVAGLAVQRPRLRDQHDVQSKPGERLVV